MSHKVSNTTWFDDSGDAYFNQLTTRDLLVKSNNQGTQYGYAAAGFTPAPSPSAPIDRFSMVSDGNAVTVGDASSPGGFRQLEGISAPTVGYLAGGNAGPTGTGQTLIRRFTFASTFVSEDSGGDLVAINSQTSAQYDGTYGYVSGGVTGSVPPTTNQSDVVQRFPFSAPFTTATDIGNLTGGRYWLTGISSTTEGWCAGGYGPGLAPSNVIDKFPFSAPFATATDAGDLTTAKYDLAGEQSDTYGYISGDNSGPGPTRNILEKFPFSAPFTTATNVGDLTEHRYSLSGSSSLTHGYNTGGTWLNPPAPATAVSTIDKFPFSTDTNSSDVGDLVLTKQTHAGLQY